MSSRRDRYSDETAKQNGSSSLEDSKCFLFKQNGASICASERLVVAVDRGDAEQKVSPLGATVVEIFQNTSYNPQTTPPIKTARNVRVVVYKTVYKSVYEADIFSTTTRLQQRIDSIGLLPVVSPCGEHCVRECLCVCGSAQTNRCIFEATSP